MFKAVFAMPSGAYRICVVLTPDETRRFASGDFPIFLDTQELRIAGPKMITAVVCSQDGEMPRITAPPHDAERAFMWQLNRWEVTGEEAIFTKPPEDDWVAEIAMLVNASDYDATLQALASRANNPLAPFVFNGPPGDNPVNLN